MFDSGYGQHRPNGDDSRGIILPPRVNNGMVNVTYKGIWLRMHIFFFYHNILIGTAITEPK